MEVLLGLGVKVGWYSTVMVAVLLLTVPLPLVTARNSCRRLVLATRERL